MVMPTKIKSNVQLLVEGNDQRNFFEGFCQHLPLSHIEIHDFGGVAELRKFLAAFRMTPGFQSVTNLGIIRDAEQDATSAFQSVQSALRNADLDAPDLPRKPSAGKPSTIVLILPEDDKSGMLESLLCKTFVNEPVNTCIDAFFKCVKAQAKVNIKRPEKARVHAYLSTKEDPHLSVGVAAKRGYWNLNHDSFSYIRDFLAKLTS